MQDFEKNKVEADQLRCHPKLHGARLQQSRDVWPRKQRIASARWMSGNKRPGICFRKDCPSSPLKLRSWIGRPGTLHSASFHRHSGLTASEKLRRLAHRGRSSNDNEAHRLELVHIIHAVSNPYMASLAFGVSESVSPSCRFHPSPSCRLCRLPELPNMSVSKLPNPMCLELCLLPLPSRRIRRSELPNPTLTNASCYVNIFPPISLHTSTSVGAPC